METTGSDGEDNNDKTVSHARTTTVSLSSLTMHARPHTLHCACTPTRTPSLPARSSAFTHVRTRVVHARPPHTPACPYTRPCSPPHTQPQPLDYTPAPALLLPSFHTPVVPSCRSPPPPPPAPSIYFSLPTATSTLNAVMVAMTHHRHTHPIKWCFFS